MRNSSKSFAHQYGISQKNVTNNPSIGIGLNPNLNIQDEYIQNLLKQTHFLNMQIKLIKQKQKQNKGMGIMGLLNKDQNPVVIHAINTNDKFTEMRHNLSKMVNNAESQHLKLDDQNFSVKAKRDFIQQFSQGQQKKNYQNQQYVNKQLIQNNNLLKQKEKRLMQLRQENSRMKDVCQKTKRDWQQLKSKQTTKRLMKQIDLGLQEQLSLITLRQSEYRQEVLKRFQKLLKEDDQKNRVDPQYIELVQENEDLQEKLRKVEKDLFDRNYRVKEMQELRKLSIRNRDYEAEAKKQAVQEAEKLKKKLADRKAEFDSRLKQSKNSLQTNDDIRLIKGKVARKNKQISDIKKKTQMSEKNYKSLRDQVQKLTIRSQQLQSLNQANEKKQNNLRAISNQQQSILTTIQNDSQQLHLEQQGLSSEVMQQRTYLQKLEEQLTYLKAKEKFLSQKINLDEGMRSVKVQQLYGLVHNNSGLNKTIGTLMEQWDEMKKFSKDLPGKGGNY